MAKTAPMRYANLSAIKQPNLKTRRGRLQGLTAIEAAPKAAIISKEAGWHV
jgi:hypothetical protein